MKTANPEQWMSAATRCALESIDGFYAIGPKPIFNRRNKWTGDEQHIATVQVRRVVNGRLAVARFGITRTLLSADIPQTVKMFAEAVAEEIFKTMAKT